ncbi:MAG: hypothetical protein ACODAC_07525 [Pseudomonadota bacterium]
MAVAPWELVTWISVAIGTAAWLARHGVALWCRYELAALARAMRARRHDAPARSPVAAAKLQ